MKINGLPLELLLEIIKEAYDLKVDKYFETQWIQSGTNREGVRILKPMKEKKSKEIESTKITQYEWIDDIRISPEQEQRERIVIQQISEYYEIVGEVLEELRKQHEIRQVCKKWIRFYYEEYKQMQKYIRDSREIFYKIMNYVVKEPMKGITRTKNIKKIWTEPTDVLKINKELRRRYYEQVINVKHSQTQWCKLCNKPVEVLPEYRKRNERRYLESANNHVETYYIQTTKGKVFFKNYLVHKDWWCKKKCKIHCLNNYKHCEYETNILKEITMKEYREYIIKNYPKLC